MKLTYSAERKKRIRDLNRGKPMYLETRNKIRAIALTRPPMSIETRAKVSANSAKAHTLYVSQLSDNPPIWVSFRTIPLAAAYCKCSEKTIRRALSLNGIIKKEYLVIRPPKGGGHLSP
jgi:hypothetical protein